MTIRELLNTFLGKGIDDLDQEVIIEIENEHGAYIENIAHIDRIDFSGEFPAIVTGEIID